jgi:hypothetical protein
LLILPQRQASQTNYLEDLTKMKKLGLFLFLALMLGVVSGSALAQAPVGDGSNYFVTYYANATVGGAPDAVVRVINDGDTGAALWASYYVFDDSQELQECCSCFVSPDGINSEDVNGDLLGNVLTGKATTKGVIKVISSSTNPGDPTNNKPAAGLRGFATHIQRATPTTGAFYVTEAPLADSNLASTEQTYLQELCQFAIILGSGRGTCKCTPEDNDF